MLIAILILLILVLVILIAMCLLLVKISDELGELWEKAQSQMEGIQRLMNWAGGVPEERSQLP